MDDYIGREKYERSNDTKTNYRNGYSSKKVSISFSEVRLDIPRDRDAKFEPKAAYICMVLDMDGKKDILGIWIGESEGAKFWLSVCNNLKNRGLNDILRACMDGLKGLPETIRMVYPDVNIQTCIVHQIRNSFRYIASKDQKEFTKDLKSVYKAFNEEIELENLDILKIKWYGKYTIVIDPCYNNWPNLSTYFEHPQDIRRIIYTTNTLEGFNIQLRKYT